jgi:hypothetical protein
MGWNEDWTAANMELRLAEEEYSIADVAISKATIRLREAQNRCAKLFRQRMDEVNTAK